MGIRKNQLCRPIDNLKWHLLNSLCATHSRPFVLAIASCVEGEGTTHTSVGVAQAMTDERRRRVLLIDLDLHGSSLRPMLEKMKDVKVSGSRNPNSPTAWRRIYSLNDNFDVLVFEAQDERNGRAEIHPDTMMRFLNRARRRYDVIILDCPPLSESPCSRILSSKADAMVLVVEASRLRREAVRSAVTNLQRMGTNLIGVVLNKQRLPIPHFLYRRF